MIKDVIVLLAILFLVTMLPADCRDPETFKAVFANPGFLNRYWKDKHIDASMESRSWTSFDAFCADVSQRAAGRPVLMDVDVHGNSDGFFLTWKDKPTAKEDNRECKASMGFIANVLDRHFLPGQLTFLTEACYSGRAYKYTIRNNSSYRMEEDEFMEDHPGVPTYPCYGIGSRTTNSGNLVFLVYERGNTDPVHIEDLRIYETLPLGFKEPCWSLREYMVFQEWQYLSGKVIRH